MLRPLSIIILIVTLAFTSVSVRAQSDALQTESFSMKTPGAFARSMFNAGKAVLMFFCPDVDTTYIEPQKYNFTAMIQNTNQIDRYTLSSGNDYSITFAPESRVKLGPYFGWRMIFLGYTFDVAIVDLINGNTDLNFNLYTASVGINFLYRRLGNYKIKRLTIADENLTDLVVNASTPGMRVNVEGINAYYVLNHDRYSHQAAYNQTNRQIRSAGSWIVGCGYDHHEIKNSWDDINNTIKKATNNKYSLGEKGAVYDEIDYRTFSGSVGYGYNWVFAKNWLAGIQGIASVSYMWSQGDAHQDDEDKKFKISDFMRNNFTIDGGLRAGVVWNNSKWFAGGSVIFNSFNYHSQDFWASNNFGTLNFYVGYNFWRMKK